MDLLRFKIKHFDEFLANPDKVVTYVSEVTLGHRWRLAVGPPDEAFGTAPRNSQSAVGKSNDKNKNDKNDGDGDGDDATAILGFKLSSTEGFNPKYRSFSIRPSQKMQRICGPSLVMSKTEWGRFEIMDRKVLKNSDLVVQEEDEAAGGTLMIELTIRRDDGDVTVWYPTLPEQNNNSTSLDLLLYQQLQASPRFADASFQVGATTFPVHRCVLELRAPLLLEFVTSEEEEVTTTANDNTTELAGIDASIFQELLCFIYTGKMDKVAIYSDETLTKSMLIAANRFGITYLKLHAESVLCEKYLDFFNAAEYLSFGHGHSCAQLKEAAMELCMKESEVVQHSDGWTFLQESPELFAELFRVATAKPSSPVPPDNYNNYSLNGNNNNNKKRKPAQVPAEQMKIAELRKNLLKEGLSLTDVDASRPVLVQKMKSYEKAFAGRHFFAKRSSSGGRP